MTRGRTVRRALIAIAGAVVVGILVWVGPFAAFHLLPPDWTGEADRLAEVLRVKPGGRVAEIGAGSGALSLAMARRVGDEGLVYATELSASRRAQIASAATEAGVTNVEVVVAGLRETGLEERCCEAIFMRNVFHHLEAADELLAQLRRALRPGGRLAVIDFAPGSLTWHLGPDHGAAIEETIRSVLAAGFRLEAQDPDWGGGTYIAVFEVASEDREGQSPQSAS